MAQIPIREYDVKKMLGAFLGTEYMGVQIKAHEDIVKLSEEKRYVIKPDMLFGKRGKRGLLGKNLTASECRAWLKKYLKKHKTIDGVDGILDVFLAEEWIIPEKEYYVSFAQTRAGDRVTFSSEGGVEIEDNWETTKSFVIPVCENLEEEKIKTLMSPLSQNLTQLISQLFAFYKSHGFTSLEFNPIIKDSHGELKILDAVGKIDDQEAYLQKNNWYNLEFPDSYGFTENAGERYIRELDAQTGASLKLKILNPEGRIWTLFAGGGGSLVMTDTLGAMGYTSEIGNYGECSGNPSREFTREYTKTVLEQMLANEKKGKYLIIAGAIANFTHIDTTFQGIINALETYSSDIIKHKIHVLVRRGGINEKTGLLLLKNACDRLGIPATITGSESYMTDILNEIHL